MMPWSWPWGVIPIQEKELKELEEKAKKLEAVKKWHKAQLGRQVDPTDIKELGEILEADD